MGIRIWSAARYVLSVPTNVVLIAASSLGYFFLTGIRTFGVEFLRGQFGLGQAVASSLLVVFGSGALIGLFLGARATGAMQRRGIAGGPMVAGGGAYVVAAALFVPAILVTSLVVVGPLLFAAAAALRAAAPPLDATRLDVMHHRLWGRAEAVRTMTRTALQAVAPLSFGAVADAFGAGTQGGVRMALLVMAAPLLLSGLVVLAGRRAYPRDVATAAASERAVRRAGVRPASWASGAG